jgi:hypothetical protein
MIKSLFTLILLGSLSAGFAQKADRNPNRSVKSEKNVTIEKSKDENPSIQNTIVEIKQSIIHADGSRTIIIKFTEVEPQQFKSDDQAEIRVPLSKMSWTKADLELYISSLMAKRSNVTVNEELHKLALSNGWYAFFDSVILEAHELLSNL